MTSPPGRQIVEGLVAGVLGGSGPSQLAGLGGGLLLAAGPDGFHRMLELALPDGVPAVPVTTLATVRSSGTWATIRAGHRLDRAGPDRVLDWVPASRGFRLWALDPDAPDGDPLPDLLGSGTWSTIGVGHHLLWLGDDLVLDREDGGHWRLFSRDDTPGAGDPLPGPALAAGDWTDIDGGHRLVALSGGRLLDHHGDTGVLRVFAVDRTAPGGDVLVRPPLLETRWDEVGPERDVVALDGDDLLDWNPVTGAFRVWRGDGAGPGSTAVTIVNEYGEPLPTVPFTVDDGTGPRLEISDGGGFATIAVDAPASLVLDRAGVLAALGDQLDRPWPPTVDLAGTVTTPATERPVTVTPGVPLTVVVASRVAVTAELASPLTGTVRVEGAGVRVSTDGQSVTVALQANGGTVASVLVDPPPAGPPAPALPDPVGWSLPDGYRVRPGDTAESLAGLFLGSPDRFAELSDHPPVEGEIITLPAEAVPDWLAGLSAAPPGPATAQPWFDVTPDAVLSVLYAGAGQAPLLDLLATMDRPPPVEADPAEQVAGQAEATLAVLALPEPLGPEIPKEPADGPLG